MGDFIVSLCECKHLNSAHDDDGCSNPRGRGVCQCDGFTVADEQPHLDTLDVIRSAIAAWGYSPTVREMAATLGLSSSASMKARLDVLERAGLITRVGPHAIRLEEGR